MPHNTHNRILITGDSGRGKTTFAENLSRKTGIETRSTDDFYYVKKFSVINEKQKSIDEIREFYKKDSWIVDGTTRHLIEGGIERADVIYVFEFSNIISQYYFIISRHFTRDNESLKDVWDLLKHVTRKRYKKNYRSHLPPLREFLKPHSDKVVYLNSMKKIDRELDKYKHR